jgi:hypothetical protein
MNVFQQVRDALAKMGLSKKQLLGNSQVDTHAVNQTPKAKRPGIIPSTISMVLPCDESMNALYKRTHRSADWLQENNNADDQ